MIKEQATNVLLELHVTSVTIKMFSYIRWTTFSFLLGSSLHISFDMLISTRSDEKFRQQQAEKAHNEVDRLSNRKQARKVVTADEAHCFYILTNPTKNIKLFFRKKNNKTSRDCLPSEQAILKDSNFEMVKRNGEG